MKELLYLISLIFLSYNLSSCHNSVKSTNVEAGGDTVKTQIEVSPNSTDTIRTLPNETALPQSGQASTESADRNNPNNNIRHEAPRHNSNDQHIIDSIKNTTKKR
ncbi:MAG: hypothetical protein PHT69_01160 [Bacteroidales bacterium]|nr:hypothetical protein [Bacteroidales bacterium]